MKMTLKTKLATRFLAENGGASANDQITMLAAALDQGRMSIGQARMTAGLIDDWSAATLKEIGDDTFAAAEAEAAAAENVLTNRMAASHGGTVEPDAHGTPRFVPLDAPATAESVLVDRMRKAHA
ncbi:MAG: hypothetical protein VR78_11035 [Hoeflea sp. BRH_c9]|nr:MAG: hypothetical protein VR78_11035 [Hoeflea sp. BRH_c9]